jgi:hypothetical protein
MDRHREKAELHGSLLAGANTFLQLVAAPDAAEKSYVLHGGIANSDGGGWYVYVASRHCNGDGRPVPPLGSNAMSAKLLDHLVRWTK